MFPSLPSRERGLKYNFKQRDYDFDEVAPLAGAWIEIAVRNRSDIANIVAPLAGAWIEMNLERLEKCSVQQSLPSRERGLKYLPLQRSVSPSLVAPLAGAWIEISILSMLHQHNTVAPLAGAWIEISPLIL